VISTLPFTMRALAKDPLVGLFSPAILAARACAQLLGVSAGVFNARRSSVEVVGKSHA
jgi:hypothetical protein